MSARSKVTAVAAPEAAAAGAAARHLTPGTSPADTRAELQRRRHEAAARSAQRRTAGSSTPAAGGTGEPATDGSSPTPTPAPSSSGAGKGAAPLFTAGPMSAAHTGGGFVLGLMAWAVARAYLTGGTTGVRALLAAKFFNKTS